jgi:N-acyl-D-aspartate/D-glutamate deacylase
MEVVGRCGGQGRKDRHDSGRIKATAMKEADATGCIVAPGAIDLHNHYDLQLNWDP